MNATRKYAVLTALAAFTAAPTLGQTSGSGEAAAPRPLPPTSHATPAVGQRYALTPPERLQPTPKQAVQRMLADARVAIAAGDQGRAQELITRANKLGVPATQFAPNEDSPAKLAMELRQPERRYDPAITNTGAEWSQLQSGVEQALHLPKPSDAGVRPAAALVGPSVGQPARLAQLPMPTEAVRPESKPAARLLAEGEQNLREGNLDGALERFQRATQAGGLDPRAQARLDGHLRMLQEPAELQPAPLGGRVVDADLLDKADDEQQVLARQLVTAVGQAQVEARQIRETEPRRALEMLNKVRGDIEKSGVSQQYRDQLVRRLSTTIGGTERYIEANKAQIELDETNAAILADVKREDAANLLKDQKVSKLIDQLNDLNDDRRYAEAEVIAKRLKELAPDEPIVRQILAMNKLLRRTRMNDEVRELKDGAIWGMDHDTERGFVFDVGDDKPMSYGPGWGDIVDRKPADGPGRMSPREQEIERKLQTPVQLRYNERPLSEVMDSLSQMTGVNIYMDPRGLNQEGVSSDTPVTLDMPGEIPLESALNLILDQFELAHTIQDDVLKVTSVSLRDGDVEPRTYYVADLVIPIPNFLPSNNMGLQGMINDALAVTGYGAGGIGAPGPIALVNGGPQSGPGNPDVLAQNLSGSGLGGGGPVNASAGGPGGLGGAASADFDSLIELITATVAADTWAENGGGEAEIRPFPTNLSLVVSQTQSVHEEIADLLDQLRRLQDLQVTIEVRFIRLSDDFFERIGIDFDMNINDGLVNTDQITQTAGGAFTNELGAGDIAQSRRGATVGVEAPIVGNLATVTADLDMPFRQGSFPLAQPTLGGFSPDSAATFGFAILSDIEAYFLINAAQGDARTNVLNAPKVTLFNGQQAFVSDVSESPFVISVVPVVGEFAAAQQPVIVVLSEGTMMSIQAVVSADRRYVRLTVVPFFSEIGDIDTFTFDGSTTTDTNTSASTTDSDDDGTNEAANNAQAQQIVTAGTTVQLPTFQFVSVTTTVSVPDGGTVLLGGIKRLAEGREELGVPLLSKIPYINRLFRNVGIGRETDSLMMMVTPRIIIQEEEEAALGLTGP